jgi:hypothetical protein
MFQATTSKKNPLLLLPTGYNEMTKTAKRRYRNREVSPSHRARAGVAPCWPRNLILFPFCFLHRRKRFCATCPCTALTSSTGSASLRSAHLMGFPRADLPLPLASPLHPPPSAPTQIAVLIAVLLSYDWAPIALSKQVGCVCGWSEASSVPPLRSSAHAPSLFINAKRVCAGGGG